MQKILMPFLGILISSTLWTNATEQKNNELKNGTSFLSKEIQFPNGMTMRIPKNWIQIPQSEIKTRNKQLKALEEQAGTLVQYEYGFQKKSSAWFTNPQIMISIHRTGKLPENVFKKHKTMQEAFQRGSEKINKSNLASISDGETLYDTKARILWSSSLVASNKGKSKTLSGTILTAEGAISVIGYFPLSEPRDLSIIEFIIRSVELPEYLKYMTRVGHAKTLDPYIQMLTEKAEQGDVHAQFDLGAGYFFGNGVTPDRAKGLQLMEEVAEQCHKQETLAECYNEVQDFEQATKWHAKAAEQGNIEAQFNLARKYYKGEGILQDYKKAVEWYTKAAKQGDAEAQFNLALMYKKGEGVLQDSKQAVKWYTKAAEQGVAKAQFNLAHKYYKGEGVHQDYKQAVKWFSKAAKQGYAKSQYSLGLMYYNGEGVPKDYAEAYAWSLHAAMNGESKLKNGLVEELTPAQIAAGQVRAKELQKEMDQAAPSAK